MNYLAAGNAEVGIAIGSNLLFGVVCAILAESRGRSPIGWFLIGFILNCIGLIVLLFLPNVHDEDERRRRLEKENRRLRQQLRSQPSVTDTEFDHALWFYLQGEEQVGPIPFAELKKVWRESRIGANTYVWRDGMGDWQMLKDLPELEQHFRA